MISSEGLIFLIFKSLVFFILGANFIKNFFIKLARRIKKTKDLKIRNIRPSEDIIIGFVNWKIDLLASLTEFKKKINN